MYFMTHCEQSSLPALPAARGIALACYTHNNVRTLTCFVFFRTDFRGEEKRNCSQSSFVIENSGKYYELLIFTNQSR